MTHGARTPPEDAPAHCFPNYAERFGAHRVPSFGRDTEVSMRRLIRRLVVDDSGQDLIEYALLAALLAVVSISALEALSPLIPKIFAQIVSSLP